MLIRLTIFISIVILLFPAAGMAGMEQRLNDLGGPQHAEAHEFQYLPPYCKCKGAVNIDPHTKEKLKKNGIAFSANILTVRTGFICIIIVMD